MKRIQQRLHWDVFAARRKLAPVESMADLVEGQFRVGRKPRGWVVRFWEYVLKGSHDECWRWNGYINTNGYGSMWISGGKRDAHRLAFLLAHGSINPALFVMHSCDNRWCVNPAHLSQGTIVDNYMDAVRKNLHPAGTRNGNAILDDFKVREIRNRCSCGEKRRKLALEYGVSVSTVKYVVSRKSWKHVT